MTTDADYNLNLARKSLQEALVALSEVVIHNCAGYEEYKEEFRDEMYQCYVELVNIKRRLE